MNYRMMTVAALLVALPACAQKKKAVINDSNTPLHLLQPAYQGTYGDLTPEQVKKDIDRVFAYIDKETPARVVDKNTGKVITDYTAMGDEAQLERGAFRLPKQQVISVILTMFRIVSAFWRKSLRISNVSMKKKGRLIRNCCKS